MAPMRVAVIFADTGVGIAETVGAMRLFLPTWSPIRVDHVRRVIVAARLRAKPLRTGPRSRPL